MYRRIMAILLSWLVMTAHAHATLQITDIAGRQVTLSAPAQRFVISEGRYVLTLALLREGNPARGLVGMMQPVGWTYPALEKQLFERYPETRDIALFGNRDAGSVSVERIIELKPDVAIFGLQDHGPGAENAELLAQLDAAGIPVVFIDFRMNPLANTTRSLQILGEVLGESARAQAFTDFHTAQRQRINARLAHLKHRPTVFLQAHPGRFDCCMAMASGMLGPFIAAAGGRNIADAVASGPTSQHTPEYLLTEDPDVWIGTASGSAEDFRNGKAFVALGAGMTAGDARQSLQKYLSTPEFQALSAVRNGRAYALWHDFYNSPLNIVALQAVARWLHPDLFRDIDPDAMLAEIDRRFLSLSLDGTFTIGLEP